MIDYIKKLLIDHNNLHIKIETLMKKQNKELLSINLLLNNMLQFYLDQIVKCFKEFRQKNLAINIQMRIFYISVLLVNVSAFVHNALFMVFIH